jgi:hypothetical protein
MRLEVLKAIVMMSSIFWDITLCILLKVNQYSVPSKCLVSFNGLDGNISHKTKLFLVKHPLRRQISAQNLWGEHENSFQ